MWISGVVYVDGEPVGSSAIDPHDYGVEKPLCLCPEVLCDVAYPFPQLSLDHVVETRIAVDFCCSLDSGCDFFERQHSAEIRPVANVAADSWEASWFGHDVTPYVSMSSALNGPLTVPGVSAARWRLEGGYQRVFNGFYDVPVRNRCIVER